MTLHKKEQHRFESLAYIFDLYKGGLIGKSQGKWKLGKFYPKDPIADFDMAVQKGRLDKKFAVLRNKKPCRDLVSDLEINYHVNGYKIGAVF